MKKRVLFLCTGNAARSQMAEGLANAFHSDVLEAVSAGSHPAGWVHPNAVCAMAEIGIDIHEAESKSAERFLNEPFEVVVTVCDSAAQACPTWPNARRIEHWSIEDPSWAPETEQYARFIETRDDLEKRIEALVEDLRK